MTAITSKINLPSILKQIKGKYSCLLLFGSYSRGDYNKDSDIDILQVTEEYRPSYSTKDFSFSVYTRQRLFEMTKTGSLFILHLVQEGKFLSGDEAILSKIKSGFVWQKDYSAYRKDLLLAAKLLDTDILQYDNSWKGFNNLLGYLFRSYLYAQLYDEDRLSFSIDNVVDEFKDKRIRKTLSLRKDTRPDFLKFIECKRVFEEYAGNKFINEFETPKGLISSLQNSSKFSTSISLHFIGSLVSDSEY